MFSLNFFAFISPTTYSHKCLALVQKCSPKTFPCVVLWSIFIPIYSDLVFNLLHLIFFLTVTCFYPSVVFDSPYLKIFSVPIKDSTVSYSSERNIWSCLLILGTLYWPTYMYIHILVSKYLFINNQKFHLVHWCMHNFAGFFRIYFPVIQLLANAHALVIQHAYPTCGLIFGQHMAS